MGKHFKELEKFKLSALKTEQACRRHVPGVTVAEIKIRADEFHAVNHPWAQSVHRSLQDPNITFVQMSQLKGVNRQ